MILLSLSSVRWSFQWRMSGGRHGWHFTGRSVVISYRSSSPGWVECGSGTADNFGSVGLETPRDGFGPEGRMKVAGGKPAPAGAPTGSTPVIPCAPGGRINLFWQSSEPPLKKRRAGRQVRPFHTSTPENECANTTSPYPNPGTPPVTRTGDTDIRDYFDINSML